MFRRGQRIIITESSAKGNAHPKSGDLGYLNNMFLFYKDRFILADAFFFSYRQEHSKNKARTERKRFIIDLGMNSSLNKKILVGAIKGSFFRTNGNVVNLLAVSEGTGHTIPGIVGPYGIWYNKRKDSSLRIPIVNIKGTSERYSLQKRPFGEIDAWSRCFWPALSAHLVGIFTGGTSGDDGDSVYRKIRSAFNAMEPYINIRSADDYIVVKLKRYDPIMSKNFIRLVKLIQVLSESYSSRKDSRLARDLSKAPSANHFMLMWQAFGLTEIRTMRDVGAGQGNIDYPFLDLVMSVIFRSLLMATDISKNLLILSGKGVCWGPHKIAERSAKFGKLREEVKGGSAALARIYKDGMLSS